MKEKLESLLEILAKHHYRMDLIIEAALIPTTSKTPEKVICELIQAANDAKNEMDFERRMRQVN